jgi:hypothetical protein
MSAHLDMLLKLDEIIILMLNHNFHLASDLRKNPIFHRHEKTEKGKLAQLYQQSVNQLYDVWGTCSLAIHDNSSTLSLLPLEILQVIMSFTIKLIQSCNESNKNIIPDLVNYLNLNKEQANKISCFIPIFNVLNDTHPSLLKSNFLKDNCSLYPYPITFFSKAGDDKAENPKGVVAHTLTFVDAHHTDCSIGNETLIDDMHGYYAANEFIVFGLYKTTKDQIKEKLSNEIRAVNANKM